MQRVFFAVIVTAVTALAESPVATIKSAGAFKLSGVSVSAPGVSSWPVTAGDRIETGDSSAVIRFADNEQIALEKGTTVQLENAGGRTVVHLTNGTMRYSLMPKGKVQVFALDQRVDTEKELQGGYSVQGQHVGKLKPGANGPGFQPPGPPERPPSRSTVRDHDR